MRYSVGTTLFIFVTVSVGIVAGYHLLAGVLWPDTERVRNRLAREFDPSRTDPAASPLFKNVSEFNLELDGVLAEPAQPVAAPPRLGWRAQLDAMAAQVKLPLSLRQLGLVAV